MRSLPTREMVSTLLRLDVDTGLFYWKVDRRHVVKAGDRAGKTDPKGYIIIKINGEGFRAHRLAWLMANGEWPTMDIDHINGVRSDNRIANLRQVTSKENSWNRCAHMCRSNSGALGVHKLPDGRFAAHITRNGKKHFLGHFIDLNDATNAYWSAREYFGCELRNPQSIPAGNPTQQGV